jgi:hypothetical protein
MILVHTYRHVKSEAKQDALPQITGRAEMIDQVAAIDYAGLYAAIAEARADATR